MLDLAVPCSFQLQDMETRVSGPLFIRKLRSQRPHLQAQHEWHGSQILVFTCTLDLQPKKKTSEDTLAQIHVQSRGAEPVVGEFSLDNGPCRLGISRSWGPSR